MLFLTLKSGVVFSVLMLANSAYALEPCQKGVSYVDISEGVSHPFAAQPPDSQSLNADGTVKEQGWHNLRNARKPLNIISYYAAGKSETVALPQGRDVCIRSPGHVTCQ